MVRAGAEIGHTESSSPLVIDHVADVLGEEPEAGFDRIEDMPAVIVASAHAISWKSPLRDQIVHGPYRRLSVVIPVRHEHSKCRIGLHHSAQLRDVCGFILGLPDWTGRSVQHNNDFEQFLFVPSAK